MYFSCVFLLSPPRGWFGVAYVHRLCGSAYSCACMHLWVCALTRIHFVCTGFLHPRALYVGTEVVGCRLCCLHTSDVCGVFVYVFASIDINISFLLIRMCTFMYTCTRIIGLGTFSYMAGLVGETIGRAHCMVSVEHETIAAQCGI